MAAASRHVPRTRAGPAPEVTLGDLLDTVYRGRKVVLAAVLAATLLGGALVAVSPQEYDAEATLVALEHHEVVEGWLRSRHAAEAAVAAMPPASASLLGSPGAPAEDAGLRLADRASVFADARTGAERRLTLVVRMPGAAVARDAVAAYLAVLETDLRPQLDELTRAKAFVLYYDGVHVEYAQDRANEAARQATYWMVLDGPAREPLAVAGNPVWKVATGATAGLVIGVLSAFAGAWAAERGVPLGRWGEALGIGPGAARPNGDPVHGPDPVRREDS